VPPGNRNTLKVHGNTTAAQFLLDITVVFWAGVAATALTLNAGQYPFHTHALVQHRFPSSLPCPSAGAAPLRVHAHALVPHSPRFVERVAQLVVTPNRIICTSVAYATAILSSAVNTAHPTYTATATTTTPGQSAFLANRNRKQSLMLPKVDASSRFKTIDQEYCHYIDNDCTGEQAEAWLADDAPGTYLFRKGTTGAELALSVKQQGGRVYHTDITMYLNTNDPMSYLLSLNKEQGPFINSLKEFVNKYDNLPYVCIIFLDPSIT
jgi:hypothetical protein